MAGSNDAQERVTSFKAIKHELKKEPGIMRHPVEQFLFNWFFATDGKVAAKIKTWFHRYCTPW